VNLSRTSSTSTWMWVKVVESQSHSSMF
jgi:hypothetical protein